MRQLKMIVGEVVIRAELLDTPQAKALYEAAPFDRVRVRFLAADPGLVTADSTA